MRENDLVAQLFNTDKFLLLTRQKIGSSYLMIEYRKMYHQDDKDINSKQLPWISINSIDLSNFQFNFSTPIEMLGETELKLLKDTESSWVEFINKSSKKDLILLIRHPFDRFISAFYQDCISPLLTNRDLSNYLTLRNILNGKITNDDFIRFENGYLNQEEWLYDNSGLNKDIAELIASHVIQLFQESNLSIEIMHNHYYLHTYRYLLTSNIIDNSKIKIIDIDSTNIASVLNKYDVHKFPTTKQNVSDWGKILNNMITKKNPSFFNKISHELTHELFHYNELINSPNFIKTVDENQ